jgi:hypothetical protein
VNNAIQMKVTALAKRDAERYVRVFGEPFNPGATDWDRAQWNRHCRSDLAHLTLDEISECWQVYHFALVTETGLLSGLIGSGK